jgi:hypothetical protein
MSNVRSIDGSAAITAVHSDSGLPDFEGMSVVQARFKLTSASNLEGPDHPNHIDDIIKMFVEGRVVRVDHVVDEKSGELHRVHTIKVVDAIQLPWNFDTGVFGAA